MCFDKILLTLFIIIVYYFIIYQLDGTSATRVRFEEDV